MKRKCLLHAHRSCSVSYSISIFILISKQTYTLLMSITQMMCLCDSHLPNRECLHEVSQCWRVALKDSGWLDIICLLSLSSSPLAQTDQFNRTGLVGKVGQEEALIWKLVTLFCCVQFSLLLLLNICLLICHFLLKVALNC